MGHKREFDFAAADFALSAWDAERLAACRQAAVGLLFGDEIGPDACCLSRQLAGDAVPGRCSACAFLVCLDCVEESDGACPVCGTAIPFPGG